MFSSVGTWPNSKRLADDLGIPLILEFRPFEVDMTIEPFIDTQTCKCPKCHSYITKYCTQKEGAIECPFCGTITQNYQPAALLSESFSIVRSSQSCKIMNCFVLDLCCENEFLELSKIYLSIALKALLPETKFIFIIIHTNYLSFIKVYEGKICFFDFPLNIRIFNATSLDFFLNQSFDAPDLIKLIKPMKQDNNILQKSTPPYEALFSNCPEGIFMNLILFTSTPIQKTGIPSVSIDVISPTDISADVQIDGLFVSPANVENFELQIQTLVQRLSDGQIAFNFEVEAFVPFPYTATPRKQRYSAIRRGFSHKVEVTFDGVVNSTQVPVQLAASFIIPVNAKQAVRRTIVLTRAFKTVKSTFMILNSVDPILIADRVSAKFVRQVYGAYQRNVLSSLPGNEEDPFFTLVPQFRWILHCLAHKLETNRGKNKKQKQKQNQGVLLIDRGSAGAEWYPEVSFWGNASEKRECEVFAVESADEDVSPRIVVADHCHRIDVFADDPIPPESALSQFLQEKVSSRFPVPMIEVRSRGQMLKLLPDEALFDEAIRDILL